MTSEQIDKLIKHIQSGGLVKLRSPYVDGFATLSKDDSGQWVIKSQVMASQPLPNVSWNNLTFYNRVELD